MLTKIRNWLRTKLSAGFWFPLLQAAIGFLYTRFSVGYRFKRWLADSGDPPRGASELYQAVLLAVAITWLALIDTAPHPLLRDAGFRICGAAVVLYVVTELFLFSLHWTFVDTGKLHAVRRSLAGFLLNLVEIAFYFSIAFSLLACPGPSTTQWGLLYDNVRAVFTLQLPIDAPAPRCRTLAHYEVIVAATLLVIVIASLVGEVVRKEKDHSQSPTSGAA